MKYATGDIIVRIQAAGPTVLLSISDNGPGLDPGELDPASLSRRVDSLPALRWIVKWPLHNVAIPAES